MRKFAAILLAAGMVFVFAPDARADIIVSDDFSSDIDW